MKSLHKVPFFVQVVSARGLRAADSNGLSDPYTVVHLGSRTDQTRVIQETLSPEWHETFVYSADDIQSALMDHMSSLLFEVWDSDFGLVADDFLGQVSACHLHAVPQNEEEMIRIVMLNFYSCYGAFVCFTSSHPGCQRP